MRLLGKQGEDWAVKYLKSNGFKILERNYRCSMGEIDIVASESDSILIKGRPYRSKEKDTIVFVEVKTRKSAELTEPFESVGKKKQAKIRNLAEYYLQEKEYFDCEIRFDVLSIVSDGKEKQIEHIKNAF